MKLQQESFPNTGTIGLPKAPPYPKRFDIEKPTPVSDFDFLSEMKNVCV